MLPFFFLILCAIKSKTIQCNSYNSYFVLFRGGNAETFLEDNIFGNLTYDDNITEINETATNQRIKPFKIWCTSCSEKFSKKMTVCKVSSQRSAELAVLIFVLYSFRQFASLLNA